MRRVYCWPLALLFLANSVFPSDAQSGAPATEAAAAVATAAGAGGDALEVVYEVRGNLSLDCSAIVDTEPPVWSINGTVFEKLPDAQQKHFKFAKNGAVLSVEGRALEEDYGNYSCSAGGRARAWWVRARTHARFPNENTNVVEGQKLKLTCKLTGKPYSPVEWYYSNVSAAMGNDSVPVLAALGGRALVRDNEQGVRDAELVVEPAQRSDAGWYQCRPTAPDAVAGVTQLRVKDMYAALWPFLGICAEVFVLCAIILIYEKRRTKPELDDSDTDNHDQKKS